MSLSANFPTVAPSLTLDFANTKQLDPRITFTRATTATYYDGVTTAKAEENLLLHSADFTNVLWTNLDTTDTANTTVAPDGTTTADTITASATTALHSIAQTSASTAGTTRTFSVFAKAGTNNFVQLFFNTDTTAYANFNITSGSGATGTVGAGATASIVDFGGGWYRCIITTTSATASATVQIALITSGTAARAESWAAAGTETIILWGAQLEQRSAVSSYTATTTQPITNYIPVLQTAASGVPRFDHNPITDVSLGLLIEEQRTNLLLRSDNFATTWATTRASVTSNSIVAPDGTLTGDQLVENTDNNTHIIEQASISFTSGTTYTVSVYAKDNGRFLQLTFNMGAFSSGPYANFNLSTGVVSASGGSGTATITSVGNGWYRCTLTATASATTTGTFFILLTSSGTALRFVSSYTGDGYKGVFLWGAQLEAGSNLTSYIATTTTTVQRNADTCSIQSIGSFFNPSEGTLYFKVAPVAQTGVSAVQYPAIGFTPADLSSTKTIQVFKASNANSWYYLVRTSTGDVVSISLNNAALSTAAIAAAYKVNDFAVVLNGGAASTDTSGDLPLSAELTALCIGSFNSTGRINSTISKISYYPLRLTNAQLQALTGS